ncbi:MAG: hypothetical protein LBU32_26965 [Clostridiales bacterium]|jgi:hypothetical protein|nr:hypothetical protein [Clostridiales bacterium]
MDCVKNGACECMLKHSQETEKSVLFSFENAEDAEEKPSRRARRPIQRAAHVFSRQLPGGRQSRWQGRQAAEASLLTAQSKGTARISARRLQNKVRLEHAPPPEPEGEARITAGGRAQEADSRLKNGWHE